MLSIGIIVVIVILGVGVIAVSALAVVKLPAKSTASIDSESIDPEKAQPAVRRLQIRRGLVVSWQSSKKSIARDVPRTSISGTTWSRRTSNATLPRAHVLDGTSKQLEARTSTCSRDVHGSEAVAQVQPPPAVYDPSFLSSIGESNHLADTTRESSWESHNGHRPTNDTLSSCFGPVTPTLENPMDRTHSLSPQSSRDKIGAARRASGASTASTVKAKDVHEETESDAVILSREIPSFETAHVDMGACLGPHPTNTTTSHSSAHSPTSDGTKHDDHYSSGYAPSIQSAIYKSPVQDITPAAPQPRKPSKLDLRGSYSQLDCAIPSPVTVSSFVTSQATTYPASVFSNQATLGACSTSAARLSTVSSQLQSNEFLDLDSRSSSRSNSVSSHSSYRSQPPSVDSPAPRARKRPPPLKLAQSNLQECPSKFRLHAADQEPGLYTGVFPSPPPSGSDSAVSWSGRADFEDSAMPHPSISGDFAPLSSVEGASKDLKSVLAQAYDKARRMESVMADEEPSSLRQAGSRPSQRPPIFGPSRSLSARFIGDAATAELARPAVVPVHQSTRSLSLSAGHSLVSTVPLSANKAPLSGLRSIWVVDKHSAATKANYVDFKALPPLPPASLSGERRSSENVLPTRGADQSRMRNVHPLPAELPAALPRSFSHTSQLPLSKTRSSSDDLRHYGSHQSLSADGTKAFQLQSTASESRNTDLDNVGFPWKRVPTIRSRELSSASSSSDSDNEDDEIQSPRPKFTPDHLLKNDALRSNVLVSQV